MTDDHTRQCLLALCAPLREAALHLSRDDTRYRPRVIALLVEIERGYDLPRTFLSRKERRERGEVEECISPY